MCDVYDNDALYLFLPKPPIVLESRCFVAILVLFLYALRVICLRGTVKRRPTNQVRGSVRSLVIWHITSWAMWIYSELCSYLAHYLMSCTFGCFIWHITSWAIRLVVSYLELYSYLAQYLMSCTFGCFIWHITWWAIRLVVSCICVCTYCIRVCA